jgi:hypothetical protein
MRTLHYNQLDPAPWNGFSILGRDLRAGSTPADTRRNAIFLVGPAGQLRERRSRSTTAPGAARLTRRRSATSRRRPRTRASRLVKFPPLVGAPNGDSHPNDFPFFRLAEMYLIKAEALNELGRTAEAIALSTAVRARAFDPAPLSRHGLAGRR